MKVKSGEYYVDEYNIKTEKAKKKGSEPKIEMNVNKK